MVSTIITAIVIVGIIALIVWGLVYLNNRDRKQQTRA
jgi:hypothetical protein